MNYPTFVKFVWVVLGVPSFSTSNEPYIIGVYEHEDDALKCYKQVKEEEVQGKWWWVKLEEKKMNSRLI